MPILAERSVSSIPPNEPAKYSRRYGRSYVHIGIARLYPDAYPLPCQDERHLSHIFGKKVTFLSHEAPPP